MLSTRSAHAASPWIARACCRHRLIDKKFELGSLCSLQRARKGRGARQHLHFLTTSHHFRVHSPHAIPTVFCISIKARGVANMDFTNTTVQLVLKNPPNTSAIGRVKDIVAGQHLELVDGKSSSMSSARPRSAQLTWGSLLPEYGPKIPNMDDPKHGSRRPQCPRTSWPNPNSTSPFASSANATSYAQDSQAVASATSSSSAHDTSPAASSTVAAGFR